MEKSLSKKLAHLIDAGTKLNPLPMRKGNSIRIGKVVVRYSQNKGYIIFDCEDNSQVCIARSKPGALAIAKVYNANDNMQDAVNYDTQYAKHDNDCIFYKHTNINTKSSFSKDLSSVRLEISKAHRESARKKLETIIFG
jgi:hypothetical protein